ncbi:non-canonical purine NTP pyrophosphatase, RdgB/HAM1 family [Euryarchaeota archaeon ex4484_162]|nr:XTP/dITP diphosphatase [Thermoplasmata archaeon]OYT58356.1 MAG: non-canonical purine NTP pyrophosphatase, RdgB/HAM1 family [Euryarchaeota archaeon ex4484_162]RLF30415.1 MAG: non-canonical purine NTP pyrophosphatase, RdgB/HAM1 family [Thermoplasmata archaeon]RLF61839.1 MAG: non-canonical purine NTP pyrophosphatase, RdgB/HAM1 family [Thermoplasmata archaeon]HDM25429.1 XTP/dITP diphosphatase [Thermoplasmatales archaeon]
MKIYFVTSNNGKYNEAKEKLKGIKNIQLEQKIINYPEIQTDTLEEVAEYGIKYLKDKLKKPFILEDAGLFIEHLKGFPGVYSAYVFKTIGCKGILNLLHDIEKRDAYFKSVIGFYNPEAKEMKIFKGISRGKISLEIRGTNGFGYDPIFIPEGESRTFGEMKINEKNKYSHRGKSFEKLASFLKKLKIENFKV